MALPFQRNTSGRFRIQTGPKLSARAGSIVFAPGWEDLLAPQVLDDMERLADVAYEEAVRLHEPDVASGDVKGSIGATLDRRDGSVYLYAPHWDAKFTEYGTGFRGRQTYGARGAGAFPSAYTPEYGGVNGIPARPFIRPAGVAAVREVFGSF
jgi:hypothetical protein